MLADHERYRDAPELVLSERVQQRYPAVVCGMLEEMFTVTNPVPKRGAISIAARPAEEGTASGGATSCKDGWKIFRTFG